MSERKRLELVRTLGSGRPYLSPGARKEKLRQRSYPRLPASGPVPYAELHCASAFSFLDGASLPEDLVARAAELGLPAVALVDRAGLYGAPRFFKAARAAGIRPLVGAEVPLSLEETPQQGARQVSGRMQGGGLVLETSVELLSPERDASKGARLVSGGRPPEAVPRAEATARNRLRPRVTLLVASRTGYRNLCRLLTLAARGKPKGDPFATWEELEAHAEGLHLLTGGSEGPLARPLEAGEPAETQKLLDRFLGIFPGRVHLELQRHGSRSQERGNRLLLELADRYRLPVVATQGARYSRREDRPLHDLLQAIAHHEPLDRMGRRLTPHAPRCLESPATMAERFRDHPEAVRHASELASQLEFTLENLGYRFPEAPVPPGETPSSWLRRLVWNAARARFRPLTARAQAQLERELALIEKLELAGYFLIVHDLVDFCRREGILCQGRGSAANSAVCYALGITAIDPVKMDLLFERFLSEERGEWPDIDLDLPSGERRERVIQYAFRRYGGTDPSGSGAAMTANHITYRDRSAIREVAKAVGYSEEQIERLTRTVGFYRADLERGDPRNLTQELAASGFDPAERRNQLLVELFFRIQNLPRHLGQHSGGVVLAAGRLDDIVPLEPAAMPDRTVIQWDKDDCADLGILKVDLLGLGMLGALEEALPLVRQHEGVAIDLAHLPMDDPRVFSMLRAADTVGVFQVESRAQMASLPRNAPERFYDLVVQVAIIRPGPITGGMVHPFFERRLGREPVTYFHPCLEPILRRTLGVPIFQEQLLRIAMVAAGFTGGEAEELRRAMGFKRSVERMQAIERRLREGMTARGIPGEAQERIVQSITSFALYGFPESHAASFALIAYASAYLKAHHPTAFLIALLNAWPMGFYHPATLVADAQRHGVRVLPIDVQRSRVECTWEDLDERAPVAGVRPPLARGSCRIGLRYVAGLRRNLAERIVAERDGRPFRSLEEFVRRTRARQDELERLATVGALASFGLSRRSALWQTSLAARPKGPLLEGDETEPSTAAPPACPLPEMTAFERTAADFAGTGLTVGPHPLAYLRPGLERKGVVSAARLSQLPHGAQARIAGAVIVRQRPGTAKGALFLTLEDETGMAQAIVSPELFRKERSTIVGAAGLLVEGRVVNRDGAISLRAEHFEPLSLFASSPSHDFH